MCRMDALQLRFFRVGRGSLTLDILLSKSHRMDTLKIFSLDPKGADYRLMSTVFGFSPYR